MNKISKIIVKPLKQSKYLKPWTMHYTHNGRSKTWDVLSVHDGVGVLLFNVTRRVLVLVKQFRPVVYLNRIPPSERTGVIDVAKYPIELRMTLEICAGILDKDVPEEQIAAEEVLEECNYKVAAENLEKIITYRADTGRTGCVQSLYYCEVTDDMRVRGSGNSPIEVVEMSIPDIKKYISQDDVNSTPLFLFVVYWFLTNKCK